MMRFLIVIVLFLTACTSAEIKRFPEPENLIKEDKMVAILKDLTVMESYVMLKMPAIQQNNKVMTASGIAILKKHQVDTISFSKSMDYYGSRQDKMQEIYSKVLDIVNRDLAKEQAKR